jgi:hypothetical protein
VSIIKLKLRHGHQIEYIRVVIIKLMLRHGHRLDFNRVSIIKLMLTDMVLMALS